MIRPAELSDAARGRSLRWFLGLISTIGMTAASSTQATAASTIAFNIAPGPLSSTLVAFAVQAHISVGLSAVGACVSPARGLVGQFTVEAGLDRLLSGSGCGVRKLDARAFEVRPSPRAPATPPVPAGPADVSELVVVATRRAAPADRLPYPVSSTSGEVMEEQGVHDLGELATITPSMIVTNLGMGRDKVLLRGVSDGPLTGRTESLVSQYLGDVRLTYNAPDPDLRLVDMQSVEVLRGPQGALYGAGSLGGVVHMVATEPDTTRNSVWVDANYGFTVGGAPSNAEDAVINLPLVMDRAAVRLALYHEVNGGYIRNSYLNIDNINKAERNGGRVSMKFIANDRWTVSAGGLIQAINVADTQYVTATQPPYTRTLRHREPSHNDFEEAHIGLNGDLGWAVARVSIAFIQHNLFNSYAAPSLLSAPTAAYGTRDKIDSLVTEETLVSEGAGAVQWLAGLFYAHTDQSSRASLTATAPPQTVDYEAVRTDNLNEGALYGEATIPLVAGWSLTAGGRLFVSSDRIGNASALAPTLQPTLYSGSADQAGFAPQIVLAWRLSPSAVTYVQANEGYRPPGVNTVAAPGERLNPPGAPEPLLAYKGDQLWSFEAGEKVTLFDGRLRLSLVGFDIEWKDIQSDQLLLSGLPFTANVGDGRNFGLEFEATFRTGGLQIQSDLLLDAPTLVRVNPSFPLLASTSLGAVPNQIFGFSIHYGRRIDRHRSLELDGRWTYVGGSQLMLNIAAVPKEGDYDTGRLAASIVDDHWRLTLAVDNPANSDANTFAYGNPFILRSTRQFTPLRPRTIWLSAAAWF